MGAVVCCGARAIAQSKSTAVIALLQRATDAPLPALIAVTGWLPHTRRAELTGLNKKRHSIEQSKRDGAACYLIMSVK